MMANLMHVFEGAAAVSAQAFVSGLWQGMALSAAAWLTLRMIPRVSAAVRFMVWSAVFAVLAVLPFLHFGASRAHEMTGSVGTVHAMHVDVRWSFAIAALWAALSLWRAAGLLASAIRLHGVWRRAVPAAEDLQILKSRAAAGPRSVQLCTSQDVDRPIVIGFFSPRVLIPQDMFGQLTRSELEQIVLHETGHLRRADDWVNLAQKIGLVLFPLNPALVWIERRLCLERELACDDSVLRQTGAPKAYATCLTTLAEHRMNRRAAALSLGAWERQTELSRRVHSILRPGKAMGQTEARVVMGILIAGVLSGAAELSRAPQLVSFSRPVVAAASSPEVQGMPEATFQPAAFHPRSEAHETLLKATMPETRNVRAVQPVVRMRRVAAQRVKRRAAIAKPQQQMVVLTSWSDGYGTRMVMAVATTQHTSDSSSYAAVPAVGGCLIIQL